MNRAFATIEPTLWTSETGREWRRLGSQHQVLGIYLFTNPHANAFGLYYLPLVLMVEETGIPRASVLKILEAFVGQDYALYDEPTEWVWVKNMCARQMRVTSMPSPSDPRAVGVRRFYERCSPNPFLGPFYDQYAELFAIDARRDGGRVRLVSSPSTTIALAAPTPRQRAAELFDEWWPHYPKPTGKKAALAEWLNVRPLPDEAFTARAIDAVEAQKRSVDWVKEGGRWIPEPERWLRKGRWEDRAPELPMISDADAQRAAAIGAWTPRHDDE
jgi:hypothetical protein